MPKGRPSSFTEKLAAEILERLTHADGGLEEVCKADDMPSDRTVYRWLAQHEEFRQAYTQAREVAGDVQAGRALRDALDAKDASLGRLAFDARRWSASKLAPKKYGDKLALTDPDGEKLVITIKQFTPPPNGA